MKYRTVVIAFTLLVVLLNACRQSDKKNDKPIVVVSVLPQQYFVERIAGDSVDVQVMIPPGASPAVYEPTMSQMIALSKASLYVKVGHPRFPFEKVWLDKLISSNANLKVVDGSKGIPLLAGDPHIWVSPDCVRSMAKSIAAQLNTLIPSKKEKFSANLKRFVADIDALDADIKKAFSKAQRRRFYVFHPAWGYFAKAYDLEQIVIEKGSKEPSPDEVKTIISRTRTEGVEIIFAQPQMSRKSADLVASELGGRVVVIDPLPRDWLASMKASTAAIGEALEQ